MIDNGEYFFPEPVYPKDDPRYKPRVRQDETGPFLFYIVPLLAIAAFLYIGFNILATI